MNNGAINGLFYLMGGIIMSISSGYLLSSAAWGWFGVGATFLTAALLAAFTGGKDESE